MASVGSKGRNLPTPGKWTIRPLPRTIQHAVCNVFDVLWDGASKGTLNNIQNLLAEGKKTLVYFSPERTFYKLTSGDDPQGLLDRCRPEAIADARRRIARATGSQTLLPV